jgi:hypothetical protein
LDNTYAVAKRDARHSIKPFPGGNGSDESDYPQLCFALEDSVDECERLQQVPGNYSRLRPAEYNWCPQKSIPHPSSHEYRDGEGRTHSRKSDNIWLSRYYLIR